MKKVLTFNGSIRKTGNTTHLLNHFLEGCRENTDQIAEISAHEINLDYCTGCLRCNIIKKCSLRGDDWQDISEKILDADILVFASPIYFHHVSGQLKKLIDRFRSFVHVQITEKGLIHTPHQLWNKEFVLLLSMGSPNDEDAQPVIDLFKYMTKILGPNNKLHVIKGTRLAVTNHVIKTEEELKTLYPKMGLSEFLATEDHKRNQEVLVKCKELGRKIVNN
jgi:multimeric flavodoxin WrbA